MRRHFTQGFLRARHQRNCPPISRHVYHIPLAFRRWHGWRYDGHVLHVVFLCKTLSNFQKLVMYLIFHGSKHTHIHSSMRAEDWANSLVSVVQMSHRESWDYDPSKNTCKCWSQPKLNTAWPGTNAGSYSTLAEARLACESQLGCSGISHKEGQYYTWLSYKTPPGHFAGWTSWMYDVNSCASESFC